MNFTKITTAGAGTMGSQVAWQMAFHGKHVVVYDAIPEGLEKGKALHREYAEHFVEQRGAAPEQVDDTFARLTYTTDLAAAVRDADLISESVPESVPIKESFWREASRHAPARTVFTTNTSTLTPSALAGFVDRPQKFLALHFAIGVWDSNIGEVMGHPGTDPAVFEGLLGFAEEIGLVPIPIRKEQSGYIINSLLVPWCTAALELLVREVSDVQSIDRTWMITMQSGMGPFGMMDRMGLGVVHHVAKLLGETTPNTQALESARYLDEHFIQKGFLGVASGQGFYRYPNPAFEPARLHLRRERCPFSHTAHVTLNQRSDELDLEAWLFGLSDSDYQACAKGHQGAGVFTDEQGRGMVNVESIGGNLIVQHYRCVRARPLYGRDVLAGKPGVPLPPRPRRCRSSLDARSEAETAMTSDFACTVQVDLPPVLALLGRLSLSATSSDITWTEARIRRRHRPRRH